MRRGMTSARLFAFSPSNSRYELASTLVRWVRCRSPRSECRALAACGTKRAVLDFGGVLFYGDRTETLRTRFCRTIQQGQEALETLARRYSTNQKTVAKWENVARQKICGQDPGIQPELRGRSKTSAICAIVVRLIFMPPYSPT